jgi:hypothetical protein
VLIKSEGEVPFYARFGMEDIYHDEEWAVIVFYRPPNCVPEDFNMLRFFDCPSEDDPGAFACGPATTRSTETWENLSGLRPGVGRL